MINILVVINVYYVNLELMKKVISVCVNMINLYIIYTKINVYYHVGKIIINLLALILKIVKHAQERQMKIIYIYVHVKTMIIQILNIYYVEIVLEMQHIINNQKFVNVIHILFRMEKNVN